jgi:prepilin-type N-terminal cleavage/methylation domain-containing protein
VAFLSSIEVDFNRCKQCVTHHDLRGFTLTEIRVVILMIAVLATVTLSNTTFRAELIVGPVGGP